MCKKYFIFAILSFVSMVFLLMFSCSKVSKPEINSFQEIKKHFTDPPAEFRSAPLTVWNDDVTEEKIEKQITEMYEQGIGGIYVHPRFGFMTEYFSDSYFSLYRFGIRQNQ